MISTQTSVFLIGGLLQYKLLLSSIVKYDNDKWTVIGSLKIARFGHQAISIGSLVMIIGGLSYDQV